MADEKYVRLILTMAPSFQGGHSKTGAEIAELFGIPFPLTVTSLSKAARERGLAPYDLWPWLKKIEDARASIAASEIIEAGAKGG